MAEPFCVLLVEDDPGIRSLVRAGLEVEGLDVISTESVAQARAVLDEPFEAVLLDRNLPDGLGDDLVGELLDRLPPSRIIVHTSAQPIEGLPSVRKGDLEGIAELLSLRRPEEIYPPAQKAQRALGRVHRRWIELCNWDPQLPPGVRPPIAETMISALTEALERPQPLGWGLDPALESVAGAFGLNVGDVPTAVAELVCLREAFRQVVINELDHDQVEALCRLQMIIDRTMQIAAESGVRRLAEEALTDPMTGLGNRRAFDQDLSRELARLSRSGERLTLALLDVDGLKAVNDSEGHPAGDRLLRHLARAIVSSIRAYDRGYRIGGDEFAILLIDAWDFDGDSLLERLKRHGAPDVTLGSASAPTDDPDHMVELADERLYSQRKTRSQRD
jgi:diguanylate cyclase (GGDEF)-like protein